MKRILTLSIVITMSALLTLTTSDSTANAARPRRYVADTGIVTLGPNQLLRITVAPAADASPQPTESISFNFTKIEYSQRNCNPVCILVGSVPVTNSITLAPGEAASFGSLADGRYVIVFRPGSPSPPNVQVNALIIDSLTGGVVSWGGVTVAASDLGGDN